MTKDDLGDRMKRYEECHNILLTRRLPLIIRIDGKAFHGLKLNKPFDEEFAYFMSQTAKKLCENIQGAVLAYTQSDEISVLVRDDQTLTTEAWFGKKLQKIVSVSASMATAFFNKMVHDAVSIDKEGYERFNVTVNFDSRAFILPPAEVCSYFIWRQQDASRNSVQMAARSIFSHKECENKNNSELQEMLFQEGINWNDFPTYFKRGLCVVRDKDLAQVEGPYWYVDTNIPIFTEDRNYVESGLVEA